MDLEHKREELMEAAAGTLPLRVAFIGLVDDLLELLHASGPLDAATLAERAEADVGYVEKWLDAAYATQLVDEHDESDEQFELTELGEAFLPDAPRTLMPLAVQTVLSARIADRLAGFVRTGDQPGEEMLGEFENIKPWFGRMLEAKFGPYFRQNVLPELEVFGRVNREGGRVLDLGCGNGWYLRELAASYENLTGVGIDQMEPSIRQAREAAAEQGLAGRLEFHEADIFDYRPDRPFDVVVLNRTLHHVWTRRDDLLATVDASLADDGELVVWEPAFPEHRQELRHPGKRMLGMRNLAEHAMQNRLLEPDEVRRFLEELGMTVEAKAIDEVERVFVARR